ncbi:glycosyltransferase family 39 protein [Mesorhizobium sp.]|uniref:ArnT family glycosyltransferase n=1 Tax=Mesorhizobium sp. TaxID=1871066 RepID=UPI000FE2B575|nr:glycosyltransferase family 39 protein [Mesorhizobium sp.]RWA75743.1 MAG: glycosyl transferase family 39 [Mesorhizobium sp.]RWB99789.1 MAG: glycosyl transferase family 39 [Mesorhizobium sp.]RWG82693.1 MAG: glycosyl transferase family 39 [Mesorhizobium sp.]RWG82786.1 MAG: glycosyl transferase family 39 [Mesorhizobium sp.]RWK10484.1 MAG: glycosyl transferase family 39 [Mesorhizobium sp.]
MRHLEKWTDWLCDERVGPFSAAIAFALAYCLVQIVVMTQSSHLMGTGVGVDDAEQLMATRFLAAGYGSSQPPLYTWLGILTASLVGTNILALKIVKYALLAGGLIASFAAVRRLGYSNRAATAAMFGLLLFPQIVWEMQHALTHSAAVFCVSSLLLLAVVEVQKRRSAAAYVLLGLATAAAMLSKYNIVIFIAALFIAALSLRETREAIFDRRLLISVIVAILACLPTFYWSLAHLEDLLAHSSGFGVAEGGNAAKTASLGILGLGNAILNFAGLPVAVFAVAFFLARRQPAPPSRPGPWPEKLLWHAIGFAVVITLVVVLAGGVTQFRDRWLLPLFVLLPAALAMRLDAMGERGRKTQATIVFAGAVIAILVMPVSWYMHIYGGDSRGSIVRTDYASLQRQLTADGPVGTVISNWFWIGNLRLVDPGLVVLDDEIPDFAKSIREPAVLVLADDEEPASVIFSRIAEAGYVMETVHRRIAVPQVLGSAPRQVTITRLHKMTAQ